MRLPQSIYFAAIFLMLTFIGACALKKHAATAEQGIWVTTGDKKLLLNKEPEGLSFTSLRKSDLKLITVDPGRTFQQIDGFGFTLTDGSATLINKLPVAEKAKLIQELFSADGIGVSYLRISLGASDLSAEPFTYNDLAAGETDINQDRFSINKAFEDLIPVLKEIRSINPAVSIMASPWSAPTWMKDNQSFKGGRLKSEYYASYAKYFVKYINGMKAAGITINAITIQNEPLHPGNVPSMYMEANDQAEFIKSALGPAFKSAGIETKIIIYDHNADKPGYPLAILKDEEARQYVDGSAFHLYGGTIDALSTVHDAFPDKHIYFTEQWVGGPGNFAEDLKWHVTNLTVGASRNWSRTVLEWNLASDPEYKPHTEGGCTNCLGAITIGPELRKNVAYYIVGHASKFVPPGSKRIYSSTAGGLDNVAFKTQDGRTVLIVVNTGAEEQRFNISFKGSMATTELQAGAVATYVW